MDLTLEAGAATRSSAERTAAYPFLFRWADVLLPAHGVTPLSAST